MITRLAKSSLAQDLPRYRSMLAGNDAYIPTAFESIASATTSAGATTVTFNSIPSTYQHLHLRAWVRSNGAFYDGGQVTMRLNNDSTTNYAKHSLRGNGSAASAAGSSSVSSVEIGGISGIGTNSTQPLVMLVDIHDYASTSKNKTIRIIEGIDNNGSGSINIASGLWMSTAAVNQLNITISTQVASGSTFALYGILGA